jgi:hypothetical protein
MTWASLYAVDGRLDGIVQRTSVGIASAVAAIIVPLLDWVHGQRGDFLRFETAPAAFLASDLPFANHRACLAWLRATFPDAKYRDGEQAVEYAAKASPGQGIPTPWCWPTGTLRAALPHSVGAGDRPRFTAGLGA